MEKEFTEIDEKNGWNPHYGEIKNKSPVFSNKIAKNPENKDRNRYRDVSPYDHSRVKLQNVENDYINASLVVTEEAQRSYILTQGPLPNTCCHFWLMVWQQKSKAIVMLNRIIEKDTVKCAQYWPTLEEEVLLFKETGLCVKLLSEDIKQNYTVRVLELQNINTEEAREIFHFHYTTWPDFGVPVSPASFLKFLFKVRESGSLNLENGPAVVHCSAGIGRSGTFSLVDTCLLLMEKRKDPSSVDIKQVLLNMRNCRMGLIQTPGQLRFSYMAVIEGEKYIMQESSVQKQQNKFQQEEHFAVSSVSRQRESREGCNGNGILTEDHLKKNSYSDSFNKHQDVVDSNIESSKQKSLQEERNDSTAHKDHVTQHSKEEESSKSDNSSNPTSLRKPGERYNGSRVEDHEENKNNSKSFNQPQDVNTESLIRKRRREDRNIITAQKVQKIKQTMNEAERKRKRPKLHDT